MLTASSAKPTLVDSTVTQTDTLNLRQGFNSEQYKKKKSPANQEKKYASQEFRARGKESGKDVQNRTETPVKSQKKKNKLFPLIP